MNAPETIPQMATILPYEARERLRRASQVEAPEGNPMARIVAIEAAISFARFQYPQFFRKEQ